MALSKRLRFEIFKRDSFRCRYCGASAPKVEIEVDHVLPRSAGGNDHPGNLVTACFDCNRGKAAVPLGFVSLLDYKAEREAEDATLLAYIRTLRPTAYQFGITEESWRAYDDGTGEWSDLALEQKAWDQIEFSDSPDLLHRDAA